MLPLVQLLLQLLLASTWSRGPDPVLILTLTLLHQAPARVLPFAVQHQVAFAGMLSFRKSSEHQHGVFVEVGRGAALSRVLPFLELQERVRFVVAFSRVLPPVEVQVLLTPVLLSPPWMLSLVQPVVEPLPRVLSFGHPVRLSGEAVCREENTQ